MTGASALEQEYKDRHGTAGQRPEGMKPVDHDWIK